MKIFKLEDFCKTSGLHLHLVRQSAPAGYYEAPHIHDYTEILYIQSGSGVNTIARSDYPIIPGDIYVSPPETLHTFCITHQAITCNLLVDFRAFSRLELDSLNEYANFSDIFMKRENTGKCLHLSAPNSMGIAEMMTAIYRSLKGHSPGYAAELHARTLLILAEICRKAGQLHDFGKMNRTTAQKLSKLTNYLAAHFRSPFRLEQIAGTMNMTPNSVSRFFAKNTGISLLAHTNLLRISEACRLLVSEPDMNVTDIAEACGFHDTSYFIRMFKKQMKTSPLAFRRKQKDA